LSKKVIEIAAKSTEQSLSKLCDEWAESLDDTVIDALDGDNKTQKKSVASKMMIWLAKIVSLSELEARSADYPPFPTFTE
jgi:hypothetical protein